MPNSKYFSCVIDDVVRVPMVRRGSTFTHPVTKQIFKLGANTEDSYLERYDLYPRLELPSTPYDPSKQTRKTLPLLWDGILKVTSPEWLVTDKTVDEVAAQKKLEVSNKLDQGLQDIIAGTSHVQRETWARFAEGALRGGSSNLLQKRADKRGVSIGQVRSEILAKTDAMDDQIADLYGQSDLLNEQVDTIIASANTDAIKITNIIAVVWPP